MDVLVGLAESSQRADVFKHGVGVSGQTALDHAGGDGSIFGGLHAGDILKLAFGEPGGEGAHAEGLQGVVGLELVQALGETAPHLGDFLVVVVAVVAVADDGECGTVDDLGLHGLPPAQERIGKLALLAFLVVVFPFVDSLSGLRWGPIVILALIFVILALGLLSISCRKTPDQLVQQALGARKAADG